MRNKVSPRRTGRVRRGGSFVGVLLDTHRRLLDARLRYHQSRVEYALAVRNVEFEKGSLLEFCKISLAG